MSRGQRSGPVSAAHSRTFLLGELVGGKVSFRAVLGETITVPWGSGCVEG